MRPGTSVVAFRLRAMSLSLMTASIETTPAQAAVPKSRSATRWVRPALSLLLPVGLAVAWETAVRLGWSNGRLVPPPSVIFNTFVDLARTGELQAHAVTTLWRVGARFGGGVGRGRARGGRAGYP